MVQCAGPEVGHSAGKVPARGITRSASSSVREPELKKPTSKQGDDLPVSASQSPDQARKKKKGLSARELEELEPSLGEDCFPPIL